VFLVLFVLQDIPRVPQPGRRIWGSMRALPKRFRHYVAAVGLFGMGNFAHTLLVLHAVSVLTPRYGASAAGKIGIGLYIFHNVLYAAVSYPIGALGDRISKMKLLAIGYALFGAMCLGFIAAGARLSFLIPLFAMAGVYIGIVDAMERALAADMLTPEERNIGYGALATVNSFGDLFSSLIVGILWSHFSAGSGFYYGAALSLLGAAVLFSFALPIRILCNQ
jgi:MFS family permease